jgi:hypothetical protein
MSTGSSGRKAESGGLAASPGPAQRMHVVFESDADTVEMQKAENFSVALQLHVDAS